MRICIPLIFLLAATAAAQPSDDAVVARVNGVPITVERFNSTYVQRLIQSGANDTAHERYAHLHNLIDTYLLGEEARRRGLEDEEYRKFIDIEIKKVLGGRYFEVAFADSLPEPSDAEVRDAFRKSNETVVLRQLYFRNAADAQAAYERLKAGENFVDIANELFETATYDSSAGYLGEADYWDLDDSVALATFELSPGDFTKPVRSKFGWHILRLENRYRNPLLTESEYLRRREDMSNRVRTRQFRLGGTRFVRSFMDSLDVQVRDEGMRALHETIQTVLRGKEEPAMPQTTLQSEEVALIEEEFSGESILATYTIDGEQKEFRVHQYFEWLEHLPYGEVKNRTAASVGRALRNEAMAARGLALGLQDDPVVTSEVNHRSLEYLADRLRKKLRIEKDVEATGEELREAYERLDYRTLRVAEADYWHLQFASFEEAEEARDGIMDGSSPQLYDSFTDYSDRDLTSLGELGTYIQKAPMRSPVVIGTGDGGWHVVRIEDRRIEYVEFEDARSDIKDRLEPFLPEMRLTRELRQDADLVIDHELFGEIMDLRTTDQDSETGTR